MGSVGSSSKNFIQRGKTIFSIQKKQGKVTTYYLKVETPNSKVAPAEYHIKNANNPDKAYVSIKGLGTANFAEDKDMYRLLKAAIKK